MDAETSILLFVEDPGAANMLAGLSQALSETGLDAIVAAADHATERLTHLGIDHIPPDGDADALLDRTRPRILAAGCAENPAAFGLRLIDAARQRDIMTVGLIDGPSNPAYRFRGTGVDPLGHAPDRLIVPDPPTAALFQDLGFAAGAIMVTGHPHFDAVSHSRTALENEGQAAVRARVFPDAPAGRPLLLFAAELSDGHDRAQFQRGENYTLTGRGGSVARTDIVLEEVLDAVAAMPPRPTLAVRLHPKNTAADFLTYRDEIDLFSAGGLPLEALFAADAVVGMSSMVMWEAALLGRPTLAILPRAMEKAWLSAIGLGIVPVATSRDDIHRMLADLLAGRLMGRNPAEVIELGAARRIAAALAAQITRPD